MFHSFIELFGNLGLSGIFILMAIESSIIPLPSEVIMIPAGVAAKQGSYALYAAILAGGFGSLAGALCNYAIGKYLGVPFLKKYGKYFLLNEEDFNAGEKMFQKNAIIATFVGRLLPGIRHVISLPAGMFHMPLVTFSIVTFLGATLWSTILAYLGYTVGNEAIKIMELYLHEAKIVIVILGILFIAWFYNRKRKQKRNGFPNKDSYNS